MVLPALILQSAPAATVSILNAVQLQLIAEITIVIQASLARPARATAAVAFPANRPA